MRLIWALVFCAMAGGVSRAGVELSDLASSSEADGKTIGETGEVRVVREIRQRDGFVTLHTRISNGSDRAIALGTMKLAELKRPWKVGRADVVPGAVFISGDSTLTCDPVARSGSERQIAASQVLALGDPVGRASLVVGYLTAQAARPEIVATVEAGGVKNLVVRQRMLGRTLGPKQSLDLDTVYLSAGDDPWAGLVAYGKRVGESAPSARRGVTALWCSWYAHRMAVSEDLVLANAAVAAKYFGPLGFEFMQIDHGWQRGDITGDWQANERFPHGLKWLSEELKKRHGLKLGLWIAPTDVAQTSETFAKHPDWMLKGPDGKPLVNWKWYWKPNPNCYELDVSQSDARNWLESVFREFSSQGVSYYKIDFIASSGGEHFAQREAGVTRGWGVLREAMEGVRKGAGEKAWIRYCQAPPVLSTGLASSAYGGDDTYDAGIDASMGSLRSNARSLAAGFWINDQMYHREVCDMSVRMQADVEETRLRLAIMSLGGCSVSFSDELQHLPMSRIRMMQQCLPAGAPAMRPMDLFERSIPSVWHLHCQRGDDAWEIVGLFNWEDEAQERTVDLAQLGLSGDVAAWEFWEQKFAGVQRGKLTMKLPARSCRIVRLTALANHPQVIGTDMHVLQGYHEMEAVKWDQATRTLSGRCKRMKGVEGGVMVYAPKAYKPRFDFPLNDTSAHLTNLGGGVWAQEIRFDEAGENFSAGFDEETK